MSEGSVGLVIEEIINTVSQRKLEYDYEIIAVNDNSPDGTFNVIKTFAENNSRIIAIDLAKNMGRHSALICGCHYAKGDYVVFVDDDLQCPVDKLWNLIKPLEDGDFDVSIAKYPKKKQSFIKNCGSKFNDIISNWLLNKKKELKATNFSVMRSFVKDEMIKYSNPYPYMEGLMFRTTDRVTNVCMEERERTIGHGNYTLKKSISLWTNNFTSFSVKPLRLASLIGSLSAFLGFLLLIYVIIIKLSDPSVPMGYSSIMAAILFMGGTIMLMLGLMGEYIGRMYISINNAPQFVVRNVVKRD